MAYRQRAAGLAGPWWGSRPAQPLLQAPCAPSEPAQCAPSLLLTALGTALTCSGGRKTQNILRHLRLAPREAGPQGPCHCWALEQTGGGGFLTAAPAPVQNEAFGGAAAEGNTRFSSCKCQGPRTATATAVGPAAVSGLSSESLQLTTPGWPPALPGKPTHAWVLSSKILLTSADENLSRGCQRDPSQSRAPAQPLLECRLTRLGRNSDTSGQNRDTPASPGAQPERTTLTLLCCPQTGSPHPRVSPACNSVPFTPHPLASLMLTGPEFKLAQLWTASSDRRASWKDSNLTQRSTRCKHRTWRHQPPWSPLPLAWLAQSPSLPGPVSPGSMSPQSCALPRGCPSFPASMWPVPASQPAPQPSGGQSRACLCSYLSGARAGTRGRRR